MEYTNHSNHLTHSELTTSLFHDNDAGGFIWNVGKNHGMWAGSQDKRYGYLRIELKRRKYLAHRLVWFYYNKVWPEGNIDHINGKPWDNRIENLRDVTQGINLENQTKARTNNLSGLLGVSPYKNKWRARIVVDGFQQSLGYFPTPEAAYEAYCTAKRSLHKGNTL